MSRHDRYFPSRQRRMLQLFQRTLKDAPVSLPVVAFLTIPRVVGTVT